MLVPCVFVCNCIWFVLFQPYLQKTKTPQSLLIRLKMPHPFPTLQSQQQRKNPWWAAKREKQGKPRSHTWSGQQMAGCHQQEVLWVRKGSIRQRKPDWAVDAHGHFGQQRPCASCGSLLKNRSVPWAWPQWHFLFLDLLENWFSSDFQMSVF